MPTYKYKDGDKEFYVSWDGFKMFNSGPLRVYEGKEQIGVINSMEELKAGREFSLKSSGTLRIYYQKVFWFIWVINADYNGKRIRATQVN